MFFILFINYNKMSSNFHVPDVFSEDGLIFLLLVNCPGLDWTNQGVCDTGATLNAGFLIHSVRDF
jgi:hypothetical protein